MQIYTISPFVSLSFDCATALPHPVSSAALAIIASKAKHNRIFFFIVLIEIKFPFELLNIVFKPTYLIFIVGYNAFQF